MSLKLACCGTLHAGRIRLVLIPSGRVVVVAMGAHKPAMTFG